MGNLEDQRRPTVGVQSRSPDNGKTAVHNVTIPVGATVGEIVGVLATLPRDARVAQTGNGVLLIHEPMEWKPGR